MIFLYKRPSRTYMKMWKWPRSYERLIEKGDEPAADRQRRRRDPPGSSEYRLSKGPKRRDPISQNVQLPDPIYRKGNQRMAGATFSIFQVFPSL